MADNAKSRRTIPVLVCPDHYYPKFEGGAEISLKIIIDNLIKVNPNYKVTVISPDTINYTSRSNLTVKKFIPRMKFSFFNNTWPFCDVISLFNYAIAIVKTQPRLILAQNYSIFPAVIIAKMFKIPVVVMLRDIGPLCPNKTGVTNQGRTCHHLYERKVCVTCFRAWKSILNPLEISRSLGYIGRIKELIYIFQNILRSGFDLHVLNSNSYNWVASALFLKLYQKRIDCVEIFNIMPFNDLLQPSLEEKKGGEREDEPSDMIRLLISLPSNGGFHKGKDFILKHILPFINRKKILYIAGLEGEHPQTNDIVMLGRIPHAEFTKWIKRVDLILVPSIWYESFGRVAIEGLTEGKGIFISPNAGVNDYIKHFENVKIIPLNARMWIDEIENFKIKPAPDFQMEINTLKLQFTPEIVCERINKALLRILV